MMKALIIVAILFFSLPVHAWYTITPLGITITATRETVKQYNRHWCTYSPEVVTFPKRPGVFKYYKDYKIGPRWENIDWSVIDGYFRLLSKKYDSYPNPSFLTVRIDPLDYSCIDESGFPYSYEFRFPGYGCIDGIFPNPNLIVIHLGDDPGQEWEYTLNRPFCATALDWEFSHYFLYWRGDPCWNNEWDPICLGRRKDIHELCLPNLE